MEISGSSSLVVAPNLLLPAPPENNPPPPPPRTQLPAVRQGVAAQSDEQNRNRPRSDVLAGELLRPGSNRLNASGDNDDTRQAGNSGRSAQGQRFSGTAAERAINAFLNVAELNAEVTVSSTGNYIDVFV